MPITKAIVSTESWIPTSLVESGIAESQALPEMTLVKSVEAESQAPVSEMEELAESEVAELQALYLEVIGSQVPTLPKSA